MELTTLNVERPQLCKLFMMSKIQNLNGTHNLRVAYYYSKELFMMSKIQNLNGTHNNLEFRVVPAVVVYDVKDTKFEWNSQRIKNISE